MKASYALTMAVAVPIAVGVAALVTGANRRFFDYDEIYHAHATWQMARGLKPFHDFQASHPPFLWYPLAVLWRILPESPASLIPLRFIAAGGTLVALAATIASFAVGRREVPWRWWMAGLFVVAFNREILDYAFEFRPDSWSAALLFGGFVAFLTDRPRALVPRYALFAGLATLAAVMSLKLILLPTIFTGLDLATRWRGGDRFDVALLGCATGVGLALLVAFAFLRVEHLDAALSFDMAVRYQWEVVRHSGFGRGLLDSVVAHSALLTVVVAGMLAWLAYLVNARRRPTTFELAVLMFLGAQLVLVDRPYKQYFAPWFLIAAGFVPFIGLLCERVLPRASSWAFAALLLSGTWTGWDALQSYRAHDQAREMLAYFETLVRIAPADKAVVAYPPLHPVVRRDVFYGWSRTTDPAGRSTETIMAALDVPGYSQRFVRPYYWHEIEANPPALVIAPLDANWGYEPAQWSVVRDYLAAHQENYVFVDRHVLRPMWVRRDGVDAKTLHELTQGPP